MKIIISALLATLLPGLASMAVAQPQPPGPQPGPQSPQPFRKGLPPAPKLPPPVFPPRIQNWPPFDPPSYQRPPTNWLPIEVQQYERIPLERLPVGRVANLDGIWYMNGDPTKPARIIQWRLDGRAMFINEHGSRTWGSVDGGSVWIPEWTDGPRQGLVGRVLGDRLVWPDGNYWSRNPQVGWPWYR